MPHFSVIIPLYNKVPYVLLAMESVAAQSYTNWELIVIDDGSTDGGEEVVKAFSDSRIHLFRQENKGVSVARNNGVVVSKGDYLCFLDADDWWDPTFLEEMAKLITNFPDSGIYGTNYTIVNETKHKTRVAKIGVTNGFEKGYINYCQVYAKTMYMPLWTGAVCIPRMVFEEMGGFPKGIRLGEDFILWVHIALKYKVAFLNKPLAYYNQDVDSTNRGVGHLHQPQHHMLWNLSDLEPYEKSNLDYKQLIDNLRVYGLLPYYLSKKNHEDAAKELAKVDWSRQPRKIWKQYHQPLAIARIIYQIKIVCSKIKQYMIKKLKQN